MTFVETLNNIYRNLLGKDLYQAIYMNVNVQLRPLPQWLFYDCYQQYTFFLRGQIEQMILVERAPNVIVDNEAARIARYRLFIGADCAGRLPGLTGAEQKETSNRVTARY